MMSITDDIPVTLVIKAPNQRMEDHTVECQSTWTIKQLKEHLESDYPSKPKLNEQRLIYFGRLLQDHMTLKEILRQYDTAEKTNRHTVHLVCSSQNERKSLASKTSSENNTSSVSQSQPVSSSQPDGLRHRPTVSTQQATTIPSTGPEMYTAYQPSSSQTMPGAFNGYDYTPEQYAAMMQQQQLYSQYMMQYMQYYQSAIFPYQSYNPQAAAFFPQAFVPTPAMPGVNGPQVAAQPQVAQPADANVPRAGPARQNVRMNAQGGMEEDDEDDGEPRDWLHHAYFFMRFLTFMGILFFYSSFTRFLVVFSGSFAIYFLQKLRKYLQRREREQQRQAAAANAANNAGGEGQDQNAADPTPPQPQVQNEGRNEQDEREQPRQDAPEQQAEGQQQGENVQIVPQENRFTRMFLFACNTVQAFFTSLVPAPPDLLEAN